MTSVPQVTGFEDRLREFFALNPESSGERTDEGFLVKNPWADETIGFRITDKSHELIESLNQIRFPTTFSGIWHQQSKDVEFIFASLPPDDPLRHRSFDFVLGTKSFTCEYGDATAALHLLIKAAKPLSAPTLTNYRNLLTAAITFGDRKRAGNKNVLTSFFIRAANLNEDDLISLCRHINFYMRYFDRSSPRILLYEEPLSPPAINRLEQMPFGPYPTAINARAMDPYLLTLAESVYNTTDPVRRFLYNFQIVEYAAFYFLRNDLMNSIQRILRSPSGLSNLDDITRQVLDLVVEDRTSDEAKLTSVVQQHVNPQLLWDIIQTSAEFFMQEVEFQGGCVIPALVRKGSSVDEFKASWIPKIPDNLRRIRNALVHAREFRQSKCILPTTGNHQLLRPWTDLMSCVANEILVYSG